MANHLGCQRLTVGDDGDQLGNYPLGERDVSRLTREGDRIATHMQIGAQYAFERAQILICRTE